jgi:DNA-nicking Smr family endonuclease
MINDDESAFLKSIAGTSPIKKNNKLKKKTPLVSVTKKEKQLIENSDTKKPQQNLNNIKNNITPNLYFNFENTPLNRRLKKGKIPIDKKIDFHGMSVFEAETLFSEIVINCYENHFRCLLFVTGKGVLKKNNENSDQVRLYYGKIRGGFFSWVKKNELQKYILAVEQAGIEHGADGAFFVYLRKKKLNFY